MKINSLRETYDKTVEAKDIQERMTEFTESLAEQTRCKRVLKVLEDAFKEVEKKNESVKYILVSPKEYAIFRKFGKDVPIDYTKQRSILVETGIFATLWGAHIVVRKDFEGVQIVCPSNEEEFKQWLPFHDTTPA